MRDEERGNRATIAELEHEIEARNEMIAILTGGLKERLAIDTPLAGRLMRDATDAECIRADARGEAYGLLDAALNKLSGGNLTRNSGDRVIAVSELLWVLAVLLEDGGDDDAENTIRMAALMARGQR